MPKSLQNYIKEAASSPKKKLVTPQVIQPVVEDMAANKPSLKEYINTVSLQKPKKIEQPVVEAASTPVLTVVQNTVEDIIPQDEPSQIEESVEYEEEIITETRDFNSTLVETLQESIEGLRLIILDQHNNQMMLTNLITGLIESLEIQNKLTDKRFESVDSQITESSRVLLEATVRLQELSVREINIPAPVVNVSLSEQKRVTKTVDRDANGLITKITEDTEQSVEKDK